MSGRKNKKRSTKKSKENTLETRRQAKAKKECRRTVEFMTKSADNFEFTARHLHALAKSMEYCATVLRTKIAIEKNIDQMATVDIA